MAARRPPKPTDHAAWETQDAAAIQALTLGKATPEQQQRALRWIVEGAANVHGDTFVPGSDDVSAFLQGRRDVGRQIVKLTKINLGLLKKEANG